MIIIIGKNGQLARSLYEASDRYDLKLYYMDRQALDLSAPRNAKQQFSDLNADLIINTAAYTDVDGAEQNVARAMQVNSEGPMALSIATNELGIPIVHISSDYVFDGMSRMPYVEGAVAKPLSVYGRSKFEGERLVAKCNPNHLIVRTSWLYSVFNKNFLKTMLSLADNRDVVKVVSDQIGSPTFALDLADALLDICRNHILRNDLSDISWGTYHVTSSGVTSWAGFAEWIFQVSCSLGGPFAEVVPISTKDFESAAERPQYSVLDCTKFRENFGIQLPHWKSGVEPCLKAILDGVSREL